MGRLAKSATPVLRKSLGVTTLATGGSLVKAVASCQRPLPVRRPRPLAHLGLRRPMCVGSAISSARTLDAAAIGAEPQPMATRAFCPPERPRSSGRLARSGRRDASGFRLFELAADAAVIGHIAFNAAAAGAGGTTEKSCLSPHGGGMSSAFQIARLKTPCSSSDQGPTIIRIAGDAAWPPSWRGATHVRRGVDDPAPRADVFACRRSPARAGERVGAAAARTHGRAQRRDCRLSWGRATPYTSPSSASGLGRASRPRKWLGRGSAAESPNTSPPPFRCAARPPRARSSARRHPSVREDGSKRCGPQ